MRAPACLAIAATLVASGASADTDAVGAMPVPEEGLVEPLENIDTTVTPAQLPRARGRWAVRKRISIGCLIGHTLFVDGYDVATERGELLLMLTDYNSPSLPVQTYPLGTIAMSTDRHWGLAAEQLPPRADSDPATGVPGAIQYAIRIARPGDGRIHQLVVYRDGFTLLVVERRVGDAAWTRRLRLDLVCTPSFLHHSIYHPH